MNRSLIKNILIPSICLLILMPGVVWIHTALPRLLRQHIHSSGFEGTLNLFWDARPYAKGITSYNNGQDPYPMDNPSDILPFAYPPVFLWVGGALTRLLPSLWGWRVYIMINVVSVALLQIILSSVFLRKLERQEAVALLSFAPLCLFSTTVFWSGNIHVVWYFTALLAAIPGLSRKSWLWFYGVVLVATMNQPVFLLLLLLPLFTATRQVLPCTIDVILAVFGYLTERMVNPSLYKAFQASVAQHLRASHDFGDGVFGMVAALLDGRTHLGLPIALGLQVTFSASIFFSLVFLRPRAKIGSVRWWGLIALAIVLVNPRVMPYDAAIGLVPACFFLVSGIRFTLEPRQVGKWLVIAAVVLGSAVAHHVLGYSLLLVAGFAAGAVKMAMCRRYSIEPDAGINLNETWTPQLELGPTRF